MTEQAGSERIDSFSDFYPYYLSQHRHPTCRRLHVAGTGLVLATLMACFATGIWWMLLALPVVGYGPAWAGHFFFENNRPATFDHPLYSLAGDFKMFGEIVTGKRPF